MREELPVWLAAPLVIVAWVAVAWMYRAAILGWVGLK